MRSSLEPPVNWNLFRRVVIGVVLFAGLVWVLG